MKNNDEPQGAGPTPDTSDNFLGNISDKPGVKSAPHHIEFTLNAWPQLPIGKKYYYCDLTPLEQRKYLYLVIKGLFHKYKQKYGLKEVHIHYELTKKGMIHCHGWMEIKESYYQSEPARLELQSYCHKLIGKKGNIKNVSSYWRYAGVAEEDILKWKQYCQKENSLKPNIIKGVTMLDFISD